MLQKYTVLKELSEQYLSHRVGVFLGGAIEHSTKAEGVFQNMKVGGIWGDQKFKLE